MVEIRRRVMATQAKGCWFCLHIGEVAIYLGSAKWGHRLELFTPFHKFRWSCIGE